MNIHIQHNVGKSQFKYLHLLELMIEVKEENVVQCVEIYT